MRFIVRYRGKGPAPAAVLERAGLAPGMRVVDQTSRTLLVEGAPEAVQAIFADTDQWLVAPEELCRMPDPRPKVKQQSGPAGKVGERPKTTRRGSSGRKGNAL
jgi:hypothetical protein